MARAFRILLLALAAAGLAAIQVRHAAVRTGPGDLTILHWFANYDEGLREVARRYEGAHPGIRVRVRLEPWNRFFTIVTTRIAAGDVPEIVETHTRWANEKHAQSGWFLDLRPAFERPSPYTGRPWIDGLLRDPTRYFRGPNGEICAVPVDMAALGIYYNKDLFRALGIEVPRTWGAFLRVMETVRRGNDRVRGRIPFLVSFESVASRWVWATGYLQEMLLASRIPALDRNGDRIVDPREWTRAWYTGALKAHDPDFAEIWRFLQSWSRYFPKDFTTPLGRDMWVRGEAAMYWGMHYEILPVLRDEIRDFEFGVFQLPIITPEDSPYSIGRPPASNIMAAGVCFSIPSRTARRGKAGLARDFLAFLTTSGNLARICGPRLGIPNDPAAIRRLAREEGLLRPFLDQNLDVVPAFPQEWVFLPASQEALFRILQEYLLGEIDLEASLDRFQAVAGEDAGRIVAREAGRPGWDVSRW